MDDTTRQDVKIIMGEGFHTAFRKATDSEQATPIWNLISEMPAQDWDNVLSFVVDGMESMGVKFSLSKG